MQSLSVKPKSCIIIIDIIASSSMLADLKIMFSPNITKIFIINIIFIATMTISCYVVPFANTRKSAISHNKVLQTLMKQGEVLHPATQTKL